MITYTAHITHHRTGVIVRRELQAADQPDAMRQAFAGQPLGTSVSLRAADRTSYHRDALIASVQGPTIARHPEPAIAFERRESQFGEMCA